MCSLIGANNFAFTFIGVELLLAKSTAFSKTLASIFTPVDKSKLLISGLPVPVSNAKQMGELFLFSQENHAVKGLFP